MEEHDTTVFALKLCSPTLKTFRPAPRCPPGVHDSRGSTRKVWIQNITASDRRKKNKRTAVGRVHVLYIVLSSVKGPGRIDFRSVELFCPSDDVKFVFRKSGETTVTIRARDVAQDTFPNYNTGLLQTTPLPRIDSKVFESSRRIKISCIRCPRLAGVSRRIILLQYVL